MWEISTFYHKKPLYDQKRTKNRLNCCRYCCPGVTFMLCGQFLSLLFFSLPAPAGFFINF